ncbi:hypothetical protein N0V85_009473 [Neurospora sp. IMI 360204]|nr:hypothetical protein N0V85_009473 [Neurospora sp. IMI 360204]
MGQLPGLSVVFPSVTGWRVTLSGIETDGSNNDESEDRSIRVDRSDPYDGLGSNDEGPEASGRNDVDDDYDGEDDNNTEDGSGFGNEHSGEEDHDDDDPIDHIPSVLPSVEGGNPSGSPEETAQNDPEATISPENRDELESGEIPQPQLPHVQRPEQQPPPPALTLNADYLEAVSPGLRAELVAYVEAISEHLRAYILPQAPASTVSAPDPPSRLLAVYQPSGRLAREIRHLIREGQALRPLSDSTTPPPGPGGHLERSPPDILAHVLNVSPSPKVGPSGSGSASQPVRGGGGGEGNVGSATSRTPAQPQPAGPSQPMPVPPMGIFFTTCRQKTLRPL